MTQVLPTPAHGTLMEALGIELTETTPQRVAGRMPVDGRTLQAFGLLHGGASVALAETLASIAGFLNAPEGQTVVGLEINANHLRSARSGYVTGVATPIHIGRRTQVWSIDIRDDQDRPVCISRCTVAAVPTSH